MRVCGKTSRTNRRARGPQGLMAVLGLILVGLMSGGCKARVEPGPMRPFTYARPAMGMEFRLVMYAAQEEVARAAAEAVFQRVSDLNLVLSDYEEDSELNRLCKSAGSGHWVAVSEDLWRVLHAGQQMAAYTGGAFDVTVGPVVQLWRRARRQRELPAPERLARARLAVGHEALELDPARRAVRLQRPGMRLDLGGIAKGYILDEARQVLVQRGIRKALLQAGGDLAVGEPPPGRSAWRIELAHLQETGEEPGAVVELRNAALATSGDLFQYVELGGVRYSHIVDPRSGMALAHRRLVFVIAPSAMTADMWSTALSVLGPETGIPLLEQSGRVAARVVQPGPHGLEIWVSRGWARYEVQGLAPGSGRFSAVRSADR